MTDPASLINLERCSVNRRPLNWFSDTSTFSSVALLSLSALRRLLFTTLTPGGALAGSWMDASDFPYWSPSCETVLKTCLKTLGRWRLILSDPLAVMMQDLIGNGQWLDSFFNSSENAVMLRSWKTITVVQYYNKVNLVVFNLLETIAQRTLPPGRCLEISSKI